MKESFTLKTTFSVKPPVIYKAWLSSKGHSAMTGGGEATCTDREGDTFSAWDGYISGTNVRLARNKEIVQTWRTSEFADSDKDSELIIRLTETKEGCELVLIHNNIPGGQPDYEQGWIDHYFTPMKQYFK